MASLSTCHLGLWLGWQILLNLAATAGRRGTERRFPIGLLSTVGQFGLSTLAPRGAAQ